MSTSLRKDPPPELFDLPHQRKPMNIYLGFAYALRRNAAQIKKKKDRTIRVQVWVQASNAQIAERVARNHFATVSRCKLAGLIPHTWEEYAQALRRAGFQVTPAPR